MVKLIYLTPGERMPELPDHEPWLTVEASDDGRFFGSGYGLSQSGEGVFYVSSAESDLSLEAATAAARDWASERGVPRIWVQTTSN
jgi:hypothetical protein